MAPDPRLDVITIGRSSVDLYGAQVGGRLEDMASFSKAVGGCPTNIAIGTARLGPEERPHHPRRRRAHGPVHPRAMRARGRRCRGRSDRSGPPHRARAARHPRRKDLPADLLPRELRRRRARRERHRSALHRKRQGGAGDRHAFRARQHGRRAAKGDADRARRRAQGRVRHRLPAEPVGPRRPWRGRGALHQVGRGHEEPERHPAAMRSHRRHRRGDDDRRRRRRSARGAESRARRKPGDARAQARPDGLRRLPRRHPRFARARRQGTGLSGRGLQRARRRRRLHVGLPARLAARRAARDLLRLRQRQRRFRRLAPAVLGRISDLGRAQPLPRARLAPSGAAPRRGAQPHPLGDDAPSRAAHDHGARDRPSRATREDRRRRREPSRAHQRLQAARGRGRRQGRGGPARLRHAARRQIWARGAVSRRRSQFLDRPAGRGARLAPARVRVRRLARRASSSNGRSRIRSSACASIIPTIRRR